MIIGLHNLISICSKRKRVGRGEGSGLGKTSGRGHKGQKARKSGNVRLGFEGGQNPLIRRVPKRGFFNRFSEKLNIVNLAQIEKYCSSVEIITPMELYFAGLIRDPKTKVKILGRGNVLKSYNIHVHAISCSAKEKIINANGKVQII
ncbi:MAG: 50S ribosomal protein L15 [Deltaproteobacteria bacterium]|nr:MAG: 50S ribosomal protein L15 [Deltaproteobacteria bacterium]